MILSDGVKILKHGACHVIAVFVEIKKGGLEARLWLFLKIVFCLCALLSRIDAHLLSFLAFTLELDDPAYFGKEGIISAFTNIEARVYSSASLSDNYIAGLNDLAAVHFYTKALGLAVSSVPCASNSFFMSHGMSSRT
jgi:hypothetical protein